MYSSFRKTIKIFNDYPEYWLLAIATGGLSFFTCWVMTYAVFEDEYSRLDGKAKLE